MTVAAKLRNGKFRLLALSIASGLTSSAIAIDTDPLDYVAPAPGTTATALYLYGLRSGQQFYRGEKIADNTLEVKSAVGMLVHFHDVGGYVVGTKLLVPYTDLSLDDNATNPGASGFGDPILVAPVWFVNKPETKTYFAINSYLQIPLGDYDKDRVLNPGQNRFSYTIQPGLSWGFTEKTTLDLVTDAQIFRDYDDLAGGGRLKRDPLYSVQTHITQQLTEKLSASIGGYYYWGGETEVNGINQRDSAANGTIIGTLSYWFTSKTNILFQYRTDTEVENGAKIDGFQVRLFHLF